MRKLTALLVVVIVALIWLGSRWRSGPSDDVRAPGGAVLTAEPAPSVSIEDPGRAQVGEAQDRPPARSAAGDSTSAPAPSAPQAECVIFGRAVDEDGHGIAGAAVRLLASPHWSERDDAPRLETKFEAHGYELRTDAEGRFRVETPLPTASFVFLSLLPDDYHDLVRIRYGGQYAGDPPPLHAGENDLGSFKLASTGALNGTVRDRQGAPIVGAEVHIGRAPTQTINRDSLSDEAGNYRIGHIAEGSHGVGVRAEGFLQEFRKPFEVRRNQTTLGPDFELREAPTIRGRVTDEAGLPLVGAQLWSWPSESGAGAGATSSADGAFVIHLPQEVAHTLEVHLDGYEPFGEGDRETVYQPGTQDIVCVLKRDVTTTFVVLDEETGQPITRFDLEVQRDKGRAAPKRSGSFTEWIPRYREHAGGELTVGARPGVDVFQVAAPEYARVTGEVVHESSASSRQVVRLGRGTTLAGRVLADGKPVWTSPGSVDTGFGNRGSRQRARRPVKGDGVWGRVRPSPVLGEPRVASAKLA